LASPAGFEPASPP